MGTTVTSSSSSGSDSLFSNSSGFHTFGRSSSPTTTSPTSHQSSGRSPPSNNHLSTCDSTTSTGGRRPSARDNSSQLAIRYFIFGPYNIDWKSIPAFDEDMAFNHATLLWRQDLRCKASRDYYIKVLNGYRIPARSSSLSSSPDTKTIVVDGEEVVDMIG